jgi:hypothetical protein
MEQIGVPMEREDWNIWFDHEPKCTTKFELHQDINAVSPIDETYDALLPIADIQEPKSPKRGRKRKLNQIDLPQTDGQNECCVNGCHNQVHNRLRFNLRVLDDFKSDFIECGWNKICSYHYFSDLYQFKKRQKKDPS